MNERSFLYVANWKMKLGHDQALELSRLHKSDFERLASVSNDIALVLCPSFDVIAEVAQLFKNSKVMIGAQNCSPYLLGNYTGEVAAESLVQLGCHFCIVGHSERRLWCGETDLVVASKIELLLQVGITPIICVGETKEQYDQGQTLHVVAQQVKAALKGVKKHSGHVHICIAYEPVWSIGTGIVPSNEHIEGVFHDIMAAANETSDNCIVTLLYGGSVDETNVAKLKMIHGLGGFLIGGASLDFQKFEKIVT